MFFFEKKNQKTFANWAEPVRKDRSPNNQKFFASFFQKRSPCPPANQTRAPATQPTSRHALLRRPEP
jgi:hypothetical protein